MQLKREIGKLWEDVSKAPYKELFNPDVAGLYLWRCVQVQRRIDEALEAQHKKPAINSKRRPIATHGNRIIAALVFAGLPVDRFKDPALDLDSVASNALIPELVDNRLDQLLVHFEKHYSNSIIPTLFKNQRKCEHLFDLVQADLI